MQQKESMPNPGTNIDTTEKITMITSDQRKGKQSRSNNNQE
jgi:hypothetical protein